MKSSNDNTHLLVGLFVLIVVIIALIVYYTRQGETKTSEQTSDTTKLTVENLTFERTLNPDPSVGDGVSGYTIEPYGVEYATGETEYKELSKNVTFTMKWTNAPGFNGVVKGFKIEHYVKATGAANYPNDANQTLLKEPDDENISITDFGACSADIVSNGEYLVIGQNSFKLYAVVQKDNQNFNWANSDTQKFVELYDGTTETPEPTELNISKSQLSVTLKMTEAETISYTPETITDTKTSTIIDKTPYKITNNAATLNIGDKDVYLTLIPQTMGKYFNFMYEDGEYLRNDLTKGPVTTTNGKTKFKFEIVDKVGNTGKIHQVSTETDDSKSKFLSSDGTTLKLYTKTDPELNPTRFTGFKWTFDKRIFEMKYFLDGTIQSVGTGVCISGDDAFIRYTIEIPNQPVNTIVKKYLGYVVYFKRSNLGVWEKKSVLSSPTDEKEEGNRFGSSFSASGDYVVIGESGKGAHVYMRTAGGIFEQSGSITTLSIPGVVNEPSDWEGWSVAIAGNTIVVGVPGRNNSTGGIRVFKRNTTGSGNNIWVNAFKNGNILEGKPGARSWFGGSVDISEDEQQIIVGALLMDKDNKINTGTAYIFKNNDDFRENKGFSSWDSSYSTTLEYTDATADLRFGAVVAISGNNGMYDAVVGCAKPFSAVYKNVSSSQGWVEARVEGISKDGGSGMSNIVAKKSSSISIYGDIIVIGHGGTIEGYTDEVTVLKKNGSDGQGPFWKHRSTISAPVKENGSSFGMSVSTNGDYIIIGEPRRKKTESNEEIRGAFYIKDV